MPIFECSRCNDMTYSASAGTADSCVVCGNTGLRVVPGAFAEARAATRDLSAGDHAMLVHDDSAEIAPFCARYLTAGIDAGEHVVCGVSDELREHVAALLAPDVAVLIDWQDPREVYADFDADRVAGRYDAMIAGEPRTVRFLAGLDEESAAAITAAEYDRYEALAHAILTGRRAIAVCLYDTRSLPAELFDVAARRHGLTVEDGVVRRNELFEYDPV